MKKLDKKIEVNFSNYPVLREKQVEVMKEFYLNQGVDRPSKLYKGLDIELENFLRTIADFNKWESVYSFSFSTEKQRDVFLLKWGLH